MKPILAIMLGVLILSCKEKKQISAFTDIEIVKDTSTNIIMTKSGIADSNNFRTFKYYDTTGRLVFIIEWGGVENLRRMISPQIVDTGINRILAGRYFYQEYLSNVFGSSNNFQALIDKNITEKKNTAFNFTDSILFKNHTLHLSQTEFDNLMDFLR